MRKIYIGSAALLGLFSGLIIGLISGIYYFIRILLGAESIYVFGKVIQANIGIGFLFLFGSIIFYLVVSSIALIIWALLYNLIANIGGALHLGLAEHDVREQ